MKQVVVLIFLSALSSHVFALSCQELADNAAQKPPPTSSQLGGFANVDEQVRGAFKFAVEQQSVSGSEQLYKALIKQGTAQDEAYRQSLDVGFRSLLRVEAATLTRLNQLMATAGSPSTYAASLCKGKSANTELESLIQPIWDEERKKAEGNLPLLQSD